MKTPEIDSGPIRIRLARAVVLMWAALFSLAAAAAPLTDGPYVMRTEKGGWVARWIEGDDAAPAVRDVGLSRGSSLKGKSVTVPAVGALPAFTVPLRAPAGVAPDEVALAPAKRLFVMADTHGEFEIAVELLRKQGVIDSALKWSFGDGHLAVLGDVFDRGPRQTELLWLIYKLELEAQSAGGGVHLVLGNHETLALLGARQYLHPKYLAAARAPGVPSYAALWDGNTLLGQWLRTKPTVQKIGGYLCLHGGLSAEIVDRGYTLDFMNKTVRDMLNFTPPYEGPNARYAPEDLQLFARKTPAATQAEREAAIFMVIHPLGPQWYRGYFPEATRDSGFPPARDGDVSRVLDHFGARAIFVGHTQIPTVTSLYDGKVIAVQVYPRRDDAGRPNMEGLLVRNGMFYRARIDGALEELPAGGKP